MEYYKEFKERRIRRILLNSMSKGEDSKVEEHSGQRWICNATGTDLQKVILSKKSLC